MQDLPSPAQRKLVHVLQDRRRRYRPLGSDKERSVDVEVVCASNLTVSDLRERLDADLFDRISHLTVRLPSLRECREDLRDDWNRVWRELRIDAGVPATAPWSESLSAELASHPLPGNLRDLQRLALLTSAWLLSEADSIRALHRAIDEWRQSIVPAAGPALADFGDGSRKQRLKLFLSRLAEWAKARWKTWGAAAEALECDEKTLRQDANVDGWQ